MEWNKKKPVGGSKYGLQLKISAPAAKKSQLKKPLPFSLDDHDEYTVEDDIARQASKKQAAQEVDVQIKQALEQDANAFDYDGVYEQMKGKQAQPIREDRAKREPKYIGKLLEKAKVRAVEHDIAFERKLTKEREKDDHLYGDKETFVTNAYKKKLIEQGKWKEEERLRDLRDKADEVTGKHDLSDFYRNLLKKNVAFGATGSRREKDQRPQDLVGGAKRPEAEPEPSSDLLREQESSAVLDKQSKTISRSGSRSDDDEDSGSRSPLASHQSKQQLRELDDQVINPGTLPGSATDTNLAQGNSPERPPKKMGIVPSTSAGDQGNRDDAVAAARERYLARKRQRE